MQRTAILFAMANTFSQSYFQLVFAVKNRDALIHKSWKDQLEKYVTAIIQNHGHKLIAIFAMPDHLHLLIGYKLTHKIPDLVEEIKTSTNAWIGKQRFSLYKFDWQKGYGAFTYSRSQIDRVANYILRQEEHHRTISFREEYMDLLNEFGIDSKLEYVFEFFD